MKHERTFVMIKPDAVQRGLIGEIVTRFEKKGMKIIAMKLIDVSRSLAEKHYGIHKDKSFFEPTVEYITSAPVVAMVLEGIDVVKIARTLIGKTDPKEAEMGTIRGDFCQFIGRNIVHGSDSAENAEIEIKLWFKPEELSKFTKINEDWMNE